MPSTTVTLFALLSILGTFQGTSGLPTGSNSRPATITGHLTAIPPDHHDLPMLVSEQSTTTLGEPLMFPESTTTLGEPLQATHSPSKSVSRVPESTTTLGEPLQATRSPSILILESTTTLGAPLQFTRTSTPVPIATGSNLTARSGPGFNSTVTHPDDLKFGSHYGWAGSFDAAGCNGNPIKGSNRPKFNDQACRKVDLPTDYLGVYWGSWPLGFTNLGLFTDEGCKNQAAVVSQDQDNGNAIGPGACVQLSQVANGTKIVGLKSLG